MPFIAECLFYHHKLRAPDHAAGWSIACPVCRNYFTLVPMAKPPAGYRLTTASSLGAPLPATTTSPLAPAKLPEAPTGPALDGLPPPEDGVPARPRGVSYLGLAALFLGSLALLAASLPRLDVLTLPCAGLGLLLAVAGVLRTHTGRRLVLPLAGLGLCGAVLLVAGLWPGVFNPLKGGGPGPAETPRSVVLPVRQGTNGTGAPETAGTWVDAEHEAVQQDDVRVHVLSASVQTAPFKDPAQARGRRERCLMIALRVQNAGAERRVAYESWGEPAGRDEAALPRLQDNNSKAYRLKSFAAGVELVGRSARARLAPGKYADDVLLFEPPAAGVEYLRLELPGSACGVGGAFRFQLPRSMVQYR